MMGRRLFCLLLLALMLTGCARLLQQPESPRVSLVHLSLRDATVFEQRYRLSLRVQNPNRFALPIEGMSYSLYLGGSEFAHGVSPVGVTVPAFGEEVLEVEMSSNLALAWQQMLRWAEQGVDGVDYRLAGEAQLKGRWLKLPFDYRGRIELAPGEGR
ncbi:LEA type 2 family protein [Alkalilimnicola sp. S0819]|uniref:LEA type 2 family protein n=1 Tax=Alkalilimnicola sp. S0819 TaxID=2613922 RepID=UPI00126248B8|nr:LEA type 2 family protein [Alkalilimnicola sp. S0819]KAB7619649.1 LEA type 2 family protein [Alkalilimnicola sp. S0819]MPQ17587.1 hypothetical protein [Alkalilimnicola sp. S0819]